ncbi:MAG TPA: hypothetical protein PLM75_05180 [bacterium]|nr:hypothetical protein [bacterium]
MKKLLFTTCLTLLYLSTLLNAQRLPLPSIDIDEPKTKTEVLPFSSSQEISSQKTALTAAASNNILARPQQTEGNFEIDNFKGVDFNPSEFSNVETPTNLDMSGAFGNLENLTKSLYANFQNAFNTIKNLTTRYNLLASKYQALVKKYNDDMRKIIAQAQQIRKQNLALNETLIKSREENNQLKATIQQQNELINNLRNSLNQRNTQLQALNSRYESAVAKLQQIRAALGAE